MAIEREMEMTEEMPEEGMAPESEETSETVSLPASMLGGKSVAPGDVVRLKVVDIGDDGSVSVTYAEEPEKQKATRGQEAIAAAFE